MRTFEIIILIVNLPIIFLLFFRPGGFRKWSQYLPLIGVASLVIHLIFEKYRYQMFPLYFLTIFFLLFAIKKFLKKDEFLIKNKIISYSFGVFATLLLCLSGVLGTLMPVFSLPEPTGVYPVGTVSYHLIDETREELYTDDPSDKREIMVQFWYPADYVQNPKPNYYWQEYDEIMGPALAKSEQLPEFTFAHFNRVKTNGMLEAPLINEQKSFPVVMYAHGQGCARSWATNQMEELASHGYIVIALDRTYSTKVTVFPDGRVIHWKSALKWIPWDKLSDSLQNGILDGSIRPVGTHPNSTGTHDSVSFRDESIKLKYDLANTDISFVINKLEELNAENSGSIFENRINLEQIGAIGFSVGGGIIEDISGRDKRIKAQILQDSGTPDSVNPVQPILCILSEYYHDKKSPKINTIKKYADENAEQKIMVDFVLIRETLHNNFTDGPLYSPLKELTAAGPIDPAYAHEIINSFIVSFCDKYLKGDENISLSELSKKYKEVYYDSIFNN